LSENDKKLIHGIVAGDEQSYNTLFNSYYRVLTVFAKKYLGDMDLSREVVQGVFVKLYESRHLLKNVDSLKSYLFRSVQNSCINELKRDQIHYKHQKRIQLRQEGNKDDMVEKMYASELEDRIFQIVSDLPGKCQQIFRMSRIDGMKNDEIASRLKLSKRTVETQISKALKTLRLKLEPYINLLIIVILCFFSGI
jgi:RNA polymerase sigma-70 factor (ECF subfamily)